MRLPVVRIKTQSIQKHRHAIETQRQEINTKRPHSLQQMNQLIKLAESEIQNRAARIAEYSRFRKLLNYPELSYQKKSQNKPAIKAEPKPKFANLRVTYKDKSKRINRLITSIFQEQQKDNSESFKLPTLSLAKSQAKRISRNSVIEQVQLKILEDSKLSETVTNFLKKSFLDIRVKLKKTGAKGH